MSSERRLFPRRPRYSTVPLRPDAPLRWRSRPALLLAGCLAVGILAARLVPAVGFWGWVAVAAGGVLLVAAANGWRQRRLVSLGTLTATLALGVTVMGLGGARLAEWRTLPADHVAHLAGRTELPVALSGTVADHPTETERGVRFTLAADSVAPAEAWLPVRGDVAVALWQPRGDAERIDYPDLHAGDRVQVVGALRTLEPNRNPADFDYGAYLARRGIHATLSGSDSTALAVTGAAPGWTDRVANPVRAHIQWALRMHVRDAEARAVLSALLLADRSRIDRDTRDAFALTGLMHLLAISGLHVLLVGMALYKLLKPMLNRLNWPWRTVEITRAAVTLVLLGTYVVATGAPPSAVRALVMAALLIVGAATERAPNSLNALGVAACVLLLLRPTFLFDVGFQLSFAAVGAIVTLMPVFGGWTPPRWTAGPVQKWVVEMTLVSLAATLGTMPVLLFHFGQVPLAGLALNLIAIPATMLTLGGGLVAVVGAGWIPLLADLAGASAEFGAWVLLWISRTGAEWLAWTSVGGYVRSGWWLAAITAGLVVVALWPRPRHRWRTAVVAMTCVAVGVWQPVWTGTAEPSLDVLFFDVGQGDAALLSLPNGRHVLVDAGVRNPYTDAGERTILPHLRFAGIDRLDAVVVTHPHADHLGGLPALLGAIPVAQVVHNGHTYASDLYDETQTLMAAQGVRSRTVTAGDTLALDPAVHIQVLGPSATPHPDEEANHGSVVLRVSYGDTSVLLTGDAEAAAEADLVAHYGPLLASDVVKVAHHGSATSSTSDFVERTGAAVAVVSVAERNRYGLPDAPVLDRWADAGATVLQTWQEGAVWLRSDGRTVERVDWR